MRTATFLAAALALAACTNDFDAFSYGEGDPMDTADGATGDGGAGSGGDGGGPIATGDAAVAGDAATGDGGDATDAGGNDAATEDAATASDAGNDAATGTDSGTDAGMDAGVDSGSPDEDAGTPPDTAACLSAVAPLSPAGEDSCDGCACGACLDPTEACIATGNSAEDALCAAVLECAFVNDCQGWDCYCGSAGCGGPNGDGPCNTQMNDASGGRKPEVIAIWTGNDQTEPLRRALDAIDCTMGLHANTPGGPTTGMCTAECM